MQGSGPLREEVAPGKLVLRRRALPVSSGALRVPLQYTHKRTLPSQPGAVPTESNLGALFPRIKRPRDRVLMASMGTSMNTPMNASMNAPMNDPSMNDELSMEKEEMGLDEALDKVNRTFAPSRIFVWVVEISVLVAFTYAMFTAIGSIVSSPTGSVPTLTLWALGSVAAATALMVVGMAFATFSENKMKLTDHRFQSVANGALTAVLAVTVVWVFYGSLVIGARETLSVNEQLAKLLFPVMFPWQDIYFVIWTVLLAIIVLIYFFLSAATTMRARGNRVFVHTSFTFHLTTMILLLQMAANHGTVVCDVRSTPWMTDTGDRYGIWNQFYLVFGIMNSSLVVCFVLQVLGDYGYQHYPLTKYPITIPLYILVNLALQMTALALFFLWDEDAALGRRERLFAPGVSGHVNTYPHLYFLGGVLTLQFTMIVGAVFNYDRDGQEFNDFRRIRQERERLQDRHSNYVFSQPMNAVLPTVDFSAGLKLD